MKTINQRLNQLVSYGLEKQMITADDKWYTINLLLDILGLDTFSEEEVELERIDDILEGILAYSVQQNLVDDTTTDKDLFDTKIMNCLMPRPGEVVAKFNELYKENKEAATNYFYDLSINSNYIRKSRIDKNISFNHYEKYGVIQITINLSKPEKDPKEIAKAKLVKSSGYPKCLLCKENVGFKGHSNHPARQNHRIIPLELNGMQYYLQYSPYVYYNEHCIVFNEDHIPMVINKETFEHLFSFIEKFPHYTLGSNADLPIVGGSILTHDHYQGGRHTFPIQEAQIVKQMQIKGYEDVKVEMVKWPLSTLRLTGESKEELVALSDYILQEWINYSDEDLDIISHSDGTRHNTITPIARMAEGKFQIDLVLRNNRTTDQHPLGIFHPHDQHHHIKKENIGLIEVMGLAILPARLKDELEALKQCLLGKENIEENESLQKHLDWFNYLKTLDYTPETVDTLLEVEVTKKFVAVLEDAGVYKMNGKGIDGFTRFVESLSK